MLSSIDINSIGHGIAGLIELYAAYWAFGIRRALAVRIYRRQALGIGLVAIGFAILDLEQTVSIFDIAVLEDSGLLFIATLFIVFLILFYWIDASMISAKRSDPLLRDSLHWSKLRILIWIVLLAWTGTDILLFGLGIILTFELLVPLVLVPISGAVALSTAVRRSNDITFHKHLKWFAIFTILLALIVPLTAPSTPSLALSIAQFAFIFPAGYSLYRSARSLVPLNKIQVEAQ